MLTASRVPGAPGMFHLIDLGTFGGTNSQAEGISPSGLVTGNARAADGVSHMFLYDGAMRDLGAYNGQDTYANAVNDNRQISGYFRVPAFGGSYPFSPLFYDGTNMNNIGTLGGNGGIASGINAAGRVAGWSYLTNGSTAHDGFLYYSNSTHRIYGYYCDAVTVDDSNRVVGYNYTVVSNYYRPIAFMHDGSFHYLGTLGGTYSTAVSINKAGRMTGESTLANGKTHAFFYDTQMRDLGTLGGDYSSGCWVNNSNDVCGTSTLANNDDRGFLYTEGRMYDVNSLLDSASREGWTVTGVWSMERCAADGGRSLAQGLRPNARGADKSLRPAFLAGFHRRSCRVFVRVAHGSSLHGRVYLKPAGRLARAFQIERRWEYDSRHILADKCHDLLPGPARRVTD